VLVTSIRNDIILLYVVLYRVLIGVPTGTESYLLEFYMCCDDLMGGWVVWCRFVCSQPSF
jgi:hypothetical protein